MGNHQTTWVLELVNKVSSPFKSINRWANTSHTSVAKLDKRLDGLKTRSGQLTRRIGKLALAGGAFAILAQGSLKFETAMSRANTMLDVSKTELKGYKSEVQSLAIESGTTRKELADGLYGTISAGVPKDNAIDFYVIQRMQLQVVLLN